MNSLLFGDVATRMGIGASGNAARFDSDSVANQSVPNPPTMRLIRVLNDAINETSNDSFGSLTMNEASMDSIQSSSSACYSLRPNRTRVPPEQIMSRSQSEESLFAPDVSAMATTTTVAITNPHSSFTTSASASASSNVMTFASTATTTNTNALPPASSNVMTSASTANTSAQASNINPASSQMLSTQQDRNRNRNIRDMQVENAHMINDFLRAQMDNTCMQGDYMRVQIDRANVAKAREEVLLETAKVDRDRVEALAEIEIDKAKQLAAIEIEGKKKQYGL